MEVRLDMKTDGQMSQLSLQQEKAECQEEPGELLLRYVCDLCVDLNSEMIKVKQVHVDHSGHTQSVSMHSTHVIHLYMFFSKCLSDLRMIQESLQMNKN